MTQKRIFTDNKSLTQLAQIFDTISVDRLEQSLIIAKGNVDLAAELLLDDTPSKASLKSTVKCSTPRKQVILYDFITENQSKRQRTIPAFPTICKTTLDATDIVNEASKSVSDNLVPNINEKLRWSESNDAKSLQQCRRPARAVDLYRPEDVAQHTPYELLLDFLPTDLANNLLKHMLTISKNWKRNRRWIFDREIVSPHTSSFFVHPEGSWTRKSKQSADASNELENTSSLMAQLEEQHWDQAWNYYSGQRTNNAPTFSPLMIEAAELVRQIVNDRIDKRGR
jgi:hypothetical protein